MGSTRQPTFVREIPIVVLWSVAAANIFVFTAKAYQRMYKSPPLKAWQSGTPGTTGSNGTQKKGGGGGGGFNPLDIIPKLVPRGPVTGIPFSPISDTSGTQNA